MTNTPILDQHLANGTIILSTITGRYCGMSDGMHDLIDFGATEDEAEAKLRMYPTTANW